ncbi:cytochrome c553 [Roseiarcus fermentans]|uniref:Cytochrome c553 n=1 Tax=Roseiarcus fermentans TaxID=1473586 RepID=A0A366FA71_9HYPH|nr:c-type cytochrome [Roseiarcus fermentans]RBP10615.1 cytochrome c553 [Roseiarcus fermentans]
MIPSAVRSFVPSAALGLLLWSGLAGAALAAADVANGEAIAKRWCAACHIVAPDQTHGADSVPTFASIARRPDFSADKTAKFLMDPHPKMPDMQLGRGEAADLGAYIASLGK